MPQPSSPYAGHAVALATRHGKQRVIGRALRHGLGAELVHLSDLDTDALGSFCGTTSRRGSALEACIAKAELALRHGGTALAIASEGSFGPHPAVPLLPIGVEVMVFLDRLRGLTIHEQLQARRTNFSQRRVTLEALEADDASSELQRWLHAVGFPRHGLIVRAAADPRAAKPASATTIHKGIHSMDALRAAIRCAAAEVPTGEVQLETDMRAHCNPTRMASIRQLSFRLVRRIATPCPSCQAPGWGLIDVLPGLPCGWCGQPTALIRGEIHGCVRCDHRQERPHRDGLCQADPGQCPFCNP